MTEVLGAGQAPRDDAGRARGELLPAGGREHRSAGGHGGVPRRARRHVHVPQRSRAAGDHELEIVEQTKPGFEHGLVALPYTFSLYPDLTIHRIYTGWWFVGRPTLEELRQDLRAIMQKCRADYEYVPPSTREP